MVPRLIEFVCALTPSWNYGKIYCSSLTRLLLLDKYGVKPEFVVRFYYLDAFIWLDPLRFFISNHEHRLN